jgi:hypothetical protein
VRLTVDQPRLERIHVRIRPREGKHGNPPHNFPGFDHRAISRAMVRIGLSTSSNFFRIFCSNLWTASAC